MFTAFENHLNQIVFESLKLTHRRRRRGGWGQWPPL